MFKKPRKNIRRKKSSSGSEGEDDNDVIATSSTIEDLKELQKQRKRINGVNIEDLAAGKELAKETKKKHDPLKLATGGYVDMKALKRGEVAEEVEEQIGTSFATETNKRDEDKEMLKYVEEEMRKRKGISEDKLDQSNMSSSADAKLYELPDHIKAIVGDGKKKSEDMLSNQMLSGIPEIDLGLTSKIKNIEATEDAKQKLLKERLSKKDKAVSDFVPTNMAVNFVQHNRYNVEDTKSDVKKVVEEPKPEPVRVGDVERLNTLEEGDRPKRKPGEKATDDFHYEKFKKHMRRF